MKPVVESVRSAVALLVAGEWVTLERLTSGRRLSASELERAVTEYGRTLSPLPESAFDELDIIEVDSGLVRTLSVRVPLWTLEEGRSDLELDLTLRELMDGIYELEIDDLHVA
jgi:hypothetical protein